MRPRTISIIKIFAVFGLAFLAAGFTSCQKVDAFKCVLITVDEQGNKRPLDQWYMYCLNQKTQAEKSIWIKDMDHCIRDQSKDCKWTATDLLEEEIIRKAVVKQCQPSTDVGNSSQP